VQFRTAGYRAISQLSKTKEAATGLPQE